MISLCDDANTDEPLAELCSGTTNYYSQNGLAIVTSLRLACRRRDVGSLRICRLNAATTAAVSLLRTLTRAAKRECGSTNVAM
jgi:hypothetical protein